MQERRDSEMLAEEDRRNDRTAAIEALSFSKQ
jgi:hypothetical protein